MNFLGHVVRSKKIGHLRITRRNEDRGGGRARERQRVKYLDAILEDLEGDLTANRLIQLARDREGWRRVTANVQDTALW